MDRNSSEETTRYKAIKEFSAITRILHWVRAFCIFVLIVTGFYIGYPFVAPINHTGEPVGFFYALTRSWHLILGFLLIAVTILRIYLYFFDKGCQMERLAWENVTKPSNWIKIIGSYLLIMPHPQLKGSYNPLQVATYSVIMLLIIAISLTGLALYANVYHEGLGGFIAPFVKPIEVMCGGLSNVRTIHHLLTWAFIIFIPVHMYLVFWNGAKYRSSADTIIGGYRFEKE